MSFALFVVLLLLGCSLGRPFVLQSSEKEPAAAPASRVPRSNRCLEQFLRTIRKTLLSGLNLQAEPQLPADGLTGIREQWTAAFSSISHSTRNNAVPVVNAEGPAAANGTELKCCQTASQISLKDLGWENWVIYPESFTFIQCKPCNSQLDLNTLRCPSRSPNPQDATSQMPCCQSTSHELLPILYMDEQGSMVISSVQLTRTCGCGPIPSED